MLKEFRDFVMRGNVLDLAVGVIIGGAFGKIVTSLVADIIMPLIGLVMGGVNLSERALVIGSASITWGVFVQNILDFIIIALVIFLIVRAANNLRKPKTPEVTTKECPYCKSSIPLKATRCPECTSQLEGASV